MTGTSPADAQTAIQRLVEDQAEAVRAGNVAGMTAPYAPDVLSFDVLDPLRSTGADQVRERAEQWVALYDGPIGYEVRDLAVTAGEDVAFASYLYRVTGTRTDGAAVDMWVRATMCYRKIDGAWTITHEHQSVPFDPETGQASLDLEP